VATSWRSELPCAGEAQAAGPQRGESSKTISLLIVGLKDDDARPAAAAALLDLGGQACSALLLVAESAVLSPTGENASSRRRRRSALELLREIGIGRDDWPTLHPSIDDPYPRIAMTACDIALALDMSGDESVHRLVGLASTTDFLLSLQIAVCVVRHYAVARDVVNSLIADHEPTSDGSGEHRLGGA
jgi:hypothetical protein